MLYDLYRLPGAAVDKIADIVLGMPQQDAGALRTTRGVHMLVAYVGAAPNNVQYLQPAHGADAAFPHLHQARASIRYRHGSPAHQRILLRRAQA